jgi:hypothetical protein
MKPSLILSVAAVIATLFGVVFLLAPVQMMSLYGVTLDESGWWIARYLGGAFIGIGLINWSARNSQDSQAFRAIVLGGFVISVLGLVVALWEGFAGQANALRWTTVVVYAILTAGYGYLQFMAPKPAAKLAGAD